MNEGDIGWIIDSGALQTAIFSLLDYDPDENTGGRTSVTQGPRIKLQRWTIDEYSEEGSWVDMDEGEAYVNYYDSTGGDIRDYPQSITVTGGPDAGTYDFVYGGDKTAEQAASEVLGMDIRDEPLYYEYTVPGLGIFRGYVGGGGGLSVAPKGAQICRCIDVNTANTSSTDTISMGSHGGSGATLTLSLSKVLTNILHYDAWQETELMKTRPGYALSVVSPAVVYLHATGILESLYPDNVPPAALGTVTLGNSGVADTNGEITLSLETYEDPQWFLDYEYHFSSILSVIIGNGGSWNLGGFDSSPVLADVAVVDWDNGVGSPSEKEMSLNLYSNSRLRISVTA